MGWTETSPRERCSFSVTFIFCFRHLRPLITEGFISRVTVWEMLFQGLMLGCFFLWRKGREEIKDLCCTFHPFLQQESWDLSSPWVHRDRFGKLVASRWTQQEFPSEKVPLLAASHFRWPLFCAAAVRSLLFAPCFPFGFISLSLFLPPFFCWRWRFLGSG